MLKDIQDALYDGQGISREVTVWLSTHRETWPEVASLLDFDLGQYLPAGRYDHHGLRNAYFTACDHQVGTEFRIALAIAQVEGRIFLPEYASDGEEQDFFQAVVCARPNDDAIPGFALVEE